MVRGVQLFPQDALLSTIQAARLPVAVLVGAPLSVDFTDVSKGVPGVDGVCELARAAVEQQNSAVLAQFDDSLRGLEGGTAYQKALAFLGGWIGQDAVNDVIRRAVLTACINKTKFDDVTGAVDDADPADWQLPPGAAQLGRLLVEASHRVTGPVLTTNFDPLVAVGVRAAGGTSARTIVDSDGNLPSDAEDAPGIPRVVHLHGYWRGSDTLHTPAQLTSQRPRLAASLRRLLENRLLIVVGYAGWDDVFTRSLADLLNDDQAALDVLWCFHEDEAALVQARYGSLLSKVGGAIARGRFRAYGGIDCHGVFDAIRAGIAGTSAVPAPVSSPLTGWQAIDEPTLSGLPELDNDELLRYFDGQVPTWRHATSSRIPRRSVVISLSDSIRTEQDANRASLHVILGAGGEGKSTTLLQVAADVARVGGWRVVWRPEPGVELSPEHVEGIPKDSHPWLLVSDDAEELVAPISVALAKAHQTGRTDIHFLVAARDTDWVSAGGLSQPWRNYAPGYSHPTTLRGVTHDDAEKLVDAWESLGDQGLGRLATSADRTARAELFVRAVQEESRRSEGSFFGGLLEARLGVDGLREHLVALLTHLKDLEVRDSTRSLADALMYVACCHGGGIDGLDEVVLADLVGVDKRVVHRDVIRPLGDEAAGVRSAGHLYTRHRKVADALLVVGHDRCGFDLPELWSNIVEQTAETSRNVEVGRQSYGPILHAGPRLSGELPDGLPEPLRAEIAVASARAAVSAKPEWSSCVVDLARTLRAAKRPAEGARLLHASLDETMKISRDWGKNVRGYLYEWGVCEGAAGRPEWDVWLSALSIANEIQPARVRREQAELSLSGLGLKFGELAEADAHGPHSKARAACAWLGFKTRPGPKSRGYFRKYERESQRAGTRQPGSLEEADSWLTAGVQAVRASLEDGGLPALVSHKSVSFDELREVLSED